MLDFFLITLAAGCGAESQDSVNFRGPVYKAQSLTMFGSREGGACRAWPGPRDPPRARARSLLTSQGSWASGELARRLRRGARPPLLRRAARRAACRAPASRPPLAGPCHSAYLRPAFLQ